MSGAGTPEGDVRVTVRKTRCWCSHVPIRARRQAVLYLDDNLRSALHARARSRKTTVSALVREAVRERYFGRRDEQRKAMQKSSVSGRNAPGPKATPSSTFEVFAGVTVWTGLK